MSLTNTATRYGTVAKTLHWAVALGILAMFLVWQHIKLTARQDKTAEEYRASLEKLAGKYDAEVERVRTRYDAVIKRYEEKHDVASTQVVNVLGDVSSTLEKVEATIEKGYAEMRTFYGEMRSSLRSSNE